MNLNKHQDFFNPINIEKPIHIIGVGAIGSYLAQQLVKLGVTNLHIWDFDTVEEHNLTNQVYELYDLNTLKTFALKTKLLLVNPKAEIHQHDKYTDEPLSGYIFLCVDSVELRKHIIEVNEFNMNIEFVSDGRIALTSGQVFSAKWDVKSDVEQLLMQCDFKDSEVSTPVSACGTTLSVSPSVLVTVSYLISNFMNYIKEKTYHNAIHFDAFNFQTKAYKNGRLT